MEMKYDYIILDVETTTHNSGSPFDTRNTCVLVGLKFPSGEYRIYDFGSRSGSLLPQGQLKRDLLEELLSTERIIGFNLKFDLHWLLLTLFQKYVPQNGVQSTIYEHHQPRRDEPLSSPVEFISRIFRNIRDCQLAFHILTGQETPYPSLNEAAAYFGHGQKDTTIEEKYWSQGIDTTDVPVGELQTYLKRDLDITEMVYTSLVETMTTSYTHLSGIVSLANQDLAVLLEMEHNGMLFDIEGVSKHADLIEAQIENQLSELGKFVPETFPVASFNFASNDHLSSLLYGGRITLLEQVPYSKILKTKKVTESSLRWESIEYTFPRLYTPLPDTELKKPGYYKTDEDTLKALSNQKLDNNPTKEKLVALLLSISSLQKLSGTYLRGLPKWFERHHRWPDGGVCRTLCSRIHGQLNQCVARTGRLSSSNPNLQNMDSKVKVYFKSRYIE